MNSNTSQQQNNSSQRKGFTFYRSYKEAIAMLPSDDQLAIYKAITDYALDGTEPDTDSLSLYCRLVWTAFLPNLQSDRQRYTNGCRGGAPQGNSNAAQSADNQKTTEKQPKNNQTVTDRQPKNNQPTTNVNVKEEVKEKENVEGEVNVNADTKEEVATTKGSPQGAATQPEALPTPQEKKSLELFENWARQHTPTLLEFTEPMTALQLAELRAKHSDRAILECAGQMHNKNAHQSNRSAFLTMRKWLK